MVKLEKIQTKRETWIDVARLVAFYTLIICHANDPFIAAATYGGDPSITVAPDVNVVTWGRIWGAMVRPCVPLFVMITGALCLPVKMQMGSFCKKRILRVLWPFLLWSVLYNLFPWFTGLLGADKSIIYTFFAWASSDSQSFADSLSRIATIPFNFNYLASHMWYIYMLIGLYLYLPIFSAWVERATRREKEWVLVLWLVSTLIPYYREFVDANLWGTCSWNEFGMLYYFSGFTGYLLAGHYVRMYLQFSWKKVLPLCLLLFFGGFAISFLGFTRMMSLENATEAQIELFWTYNSLNVVAMSLALFLLVRNVRVCSDRMKRLLASLTTCGFGVFMIHYFFVGPSYLLVMACKVPVSLVVPTSALLILIVSWTIIYWFKRLVGRKSIYFVG